MTLSYICWRDAVQSSAEDPNDPPKAELVELAEIGFLLDENDEAVQIGMEGDCASECAAGRWRLSVPHVNIKERHDVPLKDFLRWVRGREKRATR